MVLVYEKIGKFKGKEQAMRIDKQDPKPEKQHLTSDDASDLTDVPDTELLIRRAFANDANLGCELLFRLYYQPLCSHAIRFVGSREVAQDLVSDMFCRFHASQTFAGITTSYRAYLYKTIRHQAYNYLRWEVNRNADLSVAAGFTTAESQQPDSVTQYEELYQDVEAAINSLPLQRRKIYLMHRFEGKKYSEIASELQLSPRTIETQIHKASQYMRNLLRSKWALSFTTLLLLGS